QVDRKEVDSIRAVLLAVRLRAHEQRLLRDSVRRVRLLRVAVPQLVLAERDRRELGVGTDGAEEYRLRDALHTGLLEDVRPHHEIRVPVAAWARAVRADPPDLRGEMEDELGPGVVEEALGVGLPRQVVVAATGDERLDPLRPQPLHEMRAEEASSA